jgi:tetratricopeptide (TPR) repeat protein
MEVYKYLPEKTHILSTETNSGIMYAQQLIASKQYQQALNVLKQLAVMDQNSSLTYFRMAYVYSALNDPINAEKSLAKAIEIFPEYRDAVLSLSNLFKAQNKMSEAKSVLDKYVQKYPNDTAIVKFYKNFNVQDSLKRDSIKIK